MRKVLLTTTALVAMGGVSAASAIDISGGYEFGFNKTTNSQVGGNTATDANASGSEFESDANIDFTGETTTDAGFTFGGLVRIATDQTHGDQANVTSQSGIDDNTQDVYVEDQGLYVSGDFGYVMMGATDGIVDGMDNFMTSGSIVENGVATSSDANINLSSNTPDNEGAGKIGYRSPSVNGFQVGVSYEDGGDNSSENNDLTSWIVTYDLMGMATIGYAQAKVPSAQNTGADSTFKQYGINTTFAGATFQVGFGSEEIAGASGNVATSKVDTRDFAVQYDLNDAASVYFVDVISEEKTGTRVGDKLTGNTLGLSYSIAPGVSVLAEHNNAEFKDASAAGSSVETRDNTYLGLSVTF
jgi:hypothetical protein